MEPPDFLRSIDANVFGVHEAHVWITSFEISPSEVAALWQVLARDEGERAGRYRFDIDRRRFIAAQGRLRQVLGCYLCIPPGDVTFHCGAFGKPAIAAARKRSILIPREQLKFCYPYQWRWCRVNPEEPDYERYPHYRSASPLDVVVEPGDVLYMPPGTLHHVRSLDCAISFNVDWHTKASALRGVLSIVRGMPLKNVYYNSVIALGLWTGISTKRLPQRRAYSYRLC